MTQDEAKTDTTKPAESGEKKQRPFYKPGWYEELSNDEYHGSFGYSSSMLKVLNEKTPADLKHAMIMSGKMKPNTEAALRLLEDQIDANEPTANMLLGTVVHTMVLEPHKFESEFAVLPTGINLRTKAGKADMEKFQADNDGKTLITDTTLQTAKWMAESVRAHPTARLLLEDTYNEQSIFWWYKSQDPHDDERYKLLFKVRPDALPRAYPVVVDLKTTKDPGYSAFARSIHSYQYHVSAAMYLEGLNQCNQLLNHIGHFAFTKFVFICVSSTPPFLTAVYELGDEALELGKQLYRRSARILDAAQRDDWPGYPEEVRVIELPGYARFATIV